VNTDKIGYVAQTDAVYEIAHSPAQNQSEGQRTHGGSWGKIIEKHQDNDRTSYAESDENLGVVGKQTKNLPLYLPGETFDLSSPTKSVILRTPNLLGDPLSCTFYILFSACLTAQT
jgi:hypothetical protein